MMEELNYDGYRARSCNVLGSDGRPLEHLLFAPVVQKQMNRVDFIAYNRVLVVTSSLLSVVVRWDEVEDLRGAATRSVSDWVHYSYGSATPVVALAARVALCTAIEQLDGGVPSAIAVHSAGDGAERR